jgi:hypothetical protein
VRGAEKPGDRGAGEEVPVLCLGRGRGAREDVMPCADAPYADAMADDDEDGWRPGVDVRGRLEMVLLLCPRELPLAAY